MAKQKTSKLTAIKEDIQSLWQSRFNRLAIFAVAIIPLIYAALYLWAFWDPYKTVNELPVAIVNEDNGSHGADLVNTIKDSNSLNWQEVSLADADKGLEDKKYYIELIIPDDFSAKIDSLATAKPETASLIYKPRQANGLIVSQITSRVVDAITQKINEDIASTTFQSFLTGSNSLATGLNDALSGAQQLHVGLVSIQDGANQVNDGAKNLVYGSEKLSDGIAQASDATTALSSGSAQLSSGAAQVKDGVTDLKTQITSSTQATKTALNSITALLANPNGTYAPGVTNLMAAQGIVSQMQSSVQKTEADQSIDQLVTGTNQVASASSTIAASLSSLSNGMNTLSISSKKLADGAANLQSGTSALKGGIDQATTSSATFESNLQAGVGSIPSSINDSNASAKSQIFAAPVRLVNDTIDPVLNYGTGFAPYFIPLALWVGGLVIFLVIRNRKSENQLDVLAQYGVAAAIGIVQAVVLDLTLLLALGMHANHLVLFFLMSVLISLCSISVLQLLISFLGDAGKFIGILLLMLQLTSSAGTYPLETLAKFFQKIHPYLPMTYAVNGLREIISGGNSHTILMSSVVLIMITFVMLLVRQIFAGKELGARFTVEANQG